MYFRQLLSLAENVFEFEGLNKFIDVSYLNKTLLRQGSIAWFKDEVIGVIALPYRSLSTLDIYGRPKKIEVFSKANNYHRVLNKNEFVITIIDKAPAFNQLEVNNNPLEGNVEDMRIGGLGILIVKKIMSEYAYDRINNKNILVLRKRF